MKKEFKLCLSSYSAGTESRIRINLQNRTGLQDNAVPDNVGS